MRFVLFSSLVLATLGCGNGGPEIAGNFGAQTTSFGTGLDTIEGDVRWMRLPKDPRDAPDCDLADPDCDLDYRTEVAHGALIHLVSYGCSAENEEGTCTKKQPKCTAEVAVYGALEPQDRFSGNVWARLSCEDRSRLYEAESFSFGLAAPQPPATLAAAATVLGENSAERVVFANALFNIFLQAMSRYTHAPGCGDALDCPAMASCTYGRCLRIHADEPTCQVEQDKNCPSLGQDVDAAAVQAEFRRVHREALRELVREADARKEWQLIEAAVRDPAAHPETYNQIVENVRSIGKLRGSGWLSWLGVDEQTPEEKALSDLTRAVDDVNNVVAEHYYHIGEAGYVAEPEKKTSWVLTRYRDLAKANPGLNLCTEKNTRIREGCDATIDPNEVEVLSHIATGPKGKAGHRDSPRGRSICIVGSGLAATAHRYDERLSSLRHDVATTDLPLAHVSMPDPTAADPTPTDATAGELLATRTLTSGQIREVLRRAVDEIKRIRATFVDSLTDSQVDMLIRFPAVHERALLAAAPPSILTPERAAAIACQLTQERPDGYAEFFMTVAMAGGFGALLGGPVGFVLGVAAVTASAALTYISYREMERGWAESELTESLYFAGGDDADLANHLERVSAYRIAALKTAMTVASGVLTLAEGLNFLRLLRAGKAVPEEQLGKVMKNATPEERQAIQGLADHGAVAGAAYCQGNCRWTDWLWKQRNTLLNFLRKNGATNLSAPVRNVAKENAFYSALHSPEAFTNFMRSQGRTINPDDPFWNAFLSLLADPTKRHQVQNIMRRIVNNMRTIRFEEEFAHIFGAWEQFLTTLRPNDVIIMFENVQWGMVPRVGGYTFKLHDIPLAQQKSYSWVGRLIREYYPDVPVQVIDADELVDTLARLKAEGKRGRIVTADDWIMSGEDMRSNWGGRQKLFLRENGFDSNDYQVDLVVGFYTETGKADVLTGAGSEVMVIHVAPYDSARLRNVHELFPEGDPLRETWLELARLTPSSQFTKDTMTSVALPYGFGDWTTNIKIVDKPDELYLLEFVIDLTPRPYR